MKNHDDRQTMTKNPNNAEYIARINKAIDFIEKNITKPLSLEKISKVACFSPFHFHRIFKAFTGETLNTFIRRIRIEKAAMMLEYDLKSSITDIALKSGFPSSQIFARAFKDFFDMTPTAFREKSKNRNTNSKKVEALKFHLQYPVDERRPHLTFNSLSTKNMKIEIKNLPEKTVAYVRHIGPYKGDSKLFETLFGKLGQWAGPRRLIGPDVEFLSIYYDDPGVTDDEKLRMDVCLTVQNDTKVEGEIGKQVLASGEYAICRFELKEPKEFEQAWNTVYTKWLPQSGYQPDNRPAYEIYRNDPKEHPEGIHIVDICVPVKPL